MKVAVIGGGISGLSVAYYLKRSALPISQIAVFESSSRFGGWIQSKKVRFEKDGDVYFEKGPRTLRLATGALKELNSIQFAKELGLESSIDIVSKEHPASRYRYIYFNKKIVPVQMKAFSKTDLLPRSMSAYAWKEFRTPPRDSSIKDESIWSFIARRTDPSVADNLVDPVFKGICGGDIKKLSADMLLKQFYQYEVENGSILRGVFAPKPAKQSEFPDLDRLRQNYKGQSVWRLKYGSEEMIQRIVDNLAESKHVKLHLNEPIEKLQINSGNTINIKSKSIQDDFDLVVSSIYAKKNVEFLPDKCDKLKALLSKIDAVNMVVVNLYFGTDILPVKGFGYLVPTNQRSPILGCIFDSIFNEPDRKNSTLTVMMGGEWFNEFIGNKTESEIYEMAFDELKRHLNITVKPDYHEVSILKDAIPQYRVGHQNILNGISETLKEQSLENRLYLTGFSYDGIGVNDCIFNARNLVQNVLAKSPLFK